MGKRTTEDLVSEACGRRRWTEDDARRVLDAWREAWEERGESVASFCQRMGLVPLRVQRWRHRMENGSTRTLRLKAGSHCRKGKVRMTGLVPVTVRGTAVASLGAVAAVVVVSGGARIEVHDPTAAPPAWVGALVHVLEETRS